MQRKESPEACLLLRDGAPVIFLLLCAHKNLAYAGKSCLLPGLLLL